MVMTPYLTIVHLLLLRNADEAQNKLELVMASLSEPHTGQTAYPTIYVCVICHSVNAHVLIHWTALI